MPEPHYTQQDLRAAERERILWAMLGANSHTDASQRISLFMGLEELAKKVTKENVEFRELVERLEARIEELKSELAIEQLKRI